MVIGSLWKLKGSKGLMCLRLLEDIATAGHDRVFIFTGGGTTEAMDLSLTDFFAGSGILESVLPTNAKEFIMVKKASIQGFDVDGKVETRVTIEGAPIMK